jgi:hypothetical protein
VDGALEAVEDVAIPGGDDFEGEIVVVAAYFTLGHGMLLGRGG